LNGSFCDGQRSRSDQNFYRPKAEAYNLWTTMNKKPPNPIRHLLTARPPDLSARLETPGEKSQFSRLLTL